MYLKHNLRRSKISLTFPKSRSEKSFFRKKVIGDRKIVTYVTRKTVDFPSLFSNPKCLSNYMTNYYQNHSKFQKFDLLKGSEIGLQNVFVDIRVARRLYVLLSPAFNPQGAENLRIHIILPTFCQKNHLD
jgi:hypothetical protein